MRIWRRGAGLGWASAVCAIWLVAAALGAAQAPPPGGLDEQTRAQISDLKRQAYEAERDNPEKARALFDKVLQLNPDDALALQEMKSLEAAIAKKKDDQVAQAVESASREAEANRIRDLLNSAEQALAEAKSSGSSEPLARAQALLGSAERVAPPGNRDVERVKALVQAESDAQWWRRLELWLVIGGLIVAVIVALVLWLWRRTRALEMVDGPQPGQVFPLKKQASSVGALASDVDWAIPDPLRKISRHHCDVIRSGRHYFLVDRSTNGTLLNGRPLRGNEPVLLKPGDQIGLGDVTLRFR